MLQEIGGQYRRDESGAANSEKKTCTDTVMPKLLEELTGYAGHEACGCEDRDDGQ